MIDYYNDPEGFINGYLSDEDIEAKKDSIQNGLLRLRGE
jgi:hypothetical protein